MSREVPSHTGEAALPKFCRLNLLTIVLGIAAAIGGLALPVRADIVDLQNGDRYNGKVLSVTTNSLVLQSEVLGTITVPRDKIVLISLGTYATNLARRTAVPRNPPAPALTKTNGAPTMSSSLRDLGSQAEMIQQVRSQFLGDAGPEANQKFDQLLASLLTGKMSIADLRVEAKATADKARALQKELGPEAGASLDSYLAILDHFLNESGSSSDGPTNLAAPASPKLQSKSLLDDD